jgi:hypothetical protein
MPVKAMPTKEQGSNRVNRELTESDGAPGKPARGVTGEFVSEMFEYDGGRQVSVYVPPFLPEAIIFAGLFAYLVLRDSPVCLYVTCWGIATEHLDLFYGYRRSLGERRPLIEAPVHFFERTDEDAFISVLCTVFFFSWDASVFDTAGRSLLQTSHDGWLEVRASDEAFIKDVAVELESYNIPLLTR